ncbi:MAG: fatty acid desaturase [Deltaproteobacteria bacterium]|nr:MAG: fatty acid desaturase [Deltaproteobacteria bacterium]TNF29735.1 MAG: fatty acid desaturase [Deltaproteobacteria bacterium]
MEASGTEVKNEDWKIIAKKYSTPDPVKSWGQIANTLIPYFTLWYLAYRALEISIWLTIAISLLNQFFNCRTFIIMHDCGHGSFFKSKKLRTIVGTICGILTFTPYEQWTKSHATHHNTSGNLDKRGIGDIWTLTATEYGEMSPWNRLMYHLYRFPFVTFVLGPFYLFQIAYRVKAKGDGPLQDRNRWLTNFALVAIITTLCLTIGWKAFLAVHLPIVIVSNTLGAWLFFVQHQYEDVYWRKTEDYDYFQACMKGCSYLKLPKLFQFGTGNIGIHHIHHLSHKIPNYNLQRAFDENDIFQDCTILGFWDSFKGIWLKLYDENTQSMISFGEYYRRYGVRPEIFTVRAWQWVFPWFRRFQVS